MDRRPTTPRGWPARAKRCGRESSPSRARRSMAPAISVRVQTHVTTWSSSDSHPRTRSLSVSATINGNERRRVPVPHQSGDRRAPVWATPSASCGCRAAAAPVRMQPARSRTEGQRSIWSCQLHRDAGERRRPVAFLRSPWPASATCGRRSDSEVARFAAQLHTVVHLACWSASSTALVAGWGRRRRRRLRR